MKRWQFYTTVVLGVACLVLSTALVVLAHRSRKIQRQAQVQQARLNSSVLGPQAKQIAANVLQEMGAVAATNSSMRDLLKKHGYTLQTEPPEAAETSAEVETPNEDE